MSIRSDYQAVRLAADAEAGRAGVRKGARVRYKPARVAAIGQPELGALVGVVTGREKVEYRNCCLVQWDGEETFRYDVAANLEVC